MDPSKDARRRWWGSAAHGVRLSVAGLIGGVVAGAAAGLGSRVAMYFVRLMNPSYNGVPTHANAQVGQVTLEGTLSLVMDGVFYGVPGALVYLAVRRWIPGEGLRKGAVFGVFLLVVAGPVVLDGNYEYFRYVPTGISVGLFAALYPLYGLVVSPVTERLGRGASGPPHNAVAAGVGYLALAGIVVWSLARDYVVLRDVFRVFGVLG